MISRTSRGKMNHNPSSISSALSASGDRPPLDVVCVGLGCVDVAGRPIELPLKNTGVTLMDEMNLAVAGPCFGTAVAFAKLGVNVAVQGAVGRDGMAYFMVHDMKGFSIDVSNIKWKRGTRTGATMFLIGCDPLEDRATIHAHGANSLFNIDDINFKQIEKARLLYFGGVGYLQQLDGEPTVRILKFAREREIAVAIQVPPVIVPNIQELVVMCLPYVDYLIIHINTARAVAVMPNASDKELSEFFLSRGARSCIFTVSQEGSTLFRAGAPPVHVPAMIPTEPVVDTTGCGTAFAAGFLTGVLEEWDDHRCMRFASAAAALTLTQFGSDMGFSCRDEVVKFMTTIPGAVD